MGDRRVALLVDGVVGVRSIPAESLQELPPLVQDAGADVVSAIATLDDKLLMILCGARLVPDEVWTALDAKASSA